jgi:hypothetical protein
MASISVAVIYTLIAFPLEMVLLSILGISGMNNWGYIVSIILSIFISTLIGGYIFAGTIRESRREAIPKLAVLFATLLGLFAVIGAATVADWGASIKEEFLGANPGTTLSAAEWTTWEFMYLDLFSFVIVSLAIVLSLIGLYVGSMLRKPKK